MKKRNTLSLLAGTGLILMATGAGCQSDAQTGGLVGAGIGALAGQAIGGDTKGTLIGTGIGAIAGYAIGNEEDKKKMRNDYAY